MISCEKYDYIEIVCMHQYPINLTMVSGDVVSAVALDTARNEARAECIRVRVENEERLMVLDEIALLEVEVENPHFRRVAFK